MRTAALCAFLTACGSSDGGVAIDAAPAIDAEPAYDVLVFSRTLGYRHDSIPAGIDALRGLAASDGAAVTATEDPSVFREDGLRRFDAVVFLCTSGDVLDAAQQAAFEAYIAAGGGLVGIHSAADTEYDWPLYGELLGTYFRTHPVIQSAAITVEDRVHPATAHLPETWQRTDEWYDFRDNPRANVHVLATLDETTYTGGTMGADHPIAWCQEHAGGRSFYTAGGHTTDSYAEPEFRAHLLGGLRYAARRVEADCAP